MVEESVPAIPGLLIGAHELNGVNLVPTRDSVGRERDLDAVSLERSLGKFHHQVIQFRGWIGALPNGVGLSLLIVNFNFDHRSRATRLANPHFSSVYGFGILQVQPLNAAIWSLRSPGGSVVSVLINVGSSGRLIGRPFVCVL